MSEYSVVDYESRPTAVLRGHVKLADLPTFFARSLPLVLEAIETQGAVPGGEPFAYYCGMPNGSVDVEAGFPVVGAFAPFGTVVPGHLPGGGLSRVSIWDRTTAWVIRMLICALGRLLTACTPLRTCGKST